MTAERLQKFLARAGVASRRDCEALIVSGRVRVNGQVANQLGTRIDPQHDQVEVDQNIIQPPDQYVYILLHKPAGVVSTAEDPQGRQTVVDLVNNPTRLFPVGRLDVNSEGLIILTNDGELTHCLTHPRFEVEKEYRAFLNRPLDARSIHQWREGVLLDGQQTAPALVEPLEHTNQGAWVRVVLREGRKRHIREVARLLGYQVRRLIRVREGELMLGSLPSGHWRHLSNAEVQSLRAHLEQSRDTATPDDVSSDQPHSHAPARPRNRRPRRSDSSFGHRTGQSPITRKPRNKS
jgi:23S rRNA pseudouridine2605 synthase